MEHFVKFEVVRLRSHHNKYLTANADDEGSICQQRTSDAQGALWTVELIPGCPHLVRLKSCRGSYLTASDKPFLLGMTGKKVFHTNPSSLDASVEWEPMAYGTGVKLKTRDANFLRANGVVKPWRNSVTHDTPLLTTTHEWLVWAVVVVKARDVDPYGRVPPITASQSLPPTATPRPAASWKPSPSFESVVTGSISLSPKASEKASPSPESVVTSTISPAASGSASPSHDDDDDSSSASLPPASSPPRPSLWETTLSRISNRGKEAIAVVAFIVSIMEFVLALENIFHFLKGKLEMFLPS